MVLDVVQAGQVRPRGRLIDFRNLGTSIEELRAGLSMASIKRGLVRRKFWLMAETPYAVLEREEGGWDGSELPEGVLRFRLQRLMAPREWQRPSSPWHDDWFEKIARGDYAGLEVGDPQGRVWVLGHEWLSIESAGGRVTVLMMAR